MYVLFILAFMDSPSNILIMLCHMPGGELTKLGEKVAQAGGVRAIVRRVVNELVVESKGVDPQVGAWVSSSLNHLYNVHLDVEDSLTICFGAFWEYDDRSRSLVAQKAGVCLKFSERKEDSRWLFGYNIWEPDSEGVCEELPVSDWSQPDFARAPLLNYHGLCEYRR